MRRRREKNRMGRPPVRPMSPQPVPPPDRRGSTLLVVMALMALLALLGVLFYTIAAQERSNAEFFMESAQAVDEGLSPDILFNWGLDQLVNGPERRYANSALWGGRHSFRSVLFSGDVQPHTGEGVHLIEVPDPGDVSPYDSLPTVPAVDQDYDGVPDVSQELLNFSDSPVAWGGDVAAAENLLQRRPSADVDYTYPDINNLFLAYSGKALDNFNNPIDVIIPSFHRPQLLRMRGEPVNQGKIPSDWYINPNTRARVLRPHPEHRVAGFPGVRRFISNTDPLVTSGTITSGFPFAPVHPTTGASTDGEMGVWTKSSPTTYELDVDNDGNGIPDGVWLDLDFPVQERGDGKLYVPLHSFTVYSADGLFNLNAHGNITTATSLAGSPFGGPTFISQSNLGLSPAEVNPQWGLTAGSLTSDLAGPAATVFEQHNYFFGHMPVSGANVRPLEAANMEWWFLLMGRPQFQGGGTAQNITDIFPGRWGEINRLFQGVTNRVTVGFPWPGQAPAPGQSVQQVDSLYAGGNGNFFEGQRPPFGHPLDFSGAGRYTDAAPMTYGKRAKLAKPIANNPSRWLEYTDYDRGDNGAGVPQVAYANVQGGALMPSVSGAASGLWYDPTETILAEDKVRPGTDNVFGTDEMAFLHLSETALDETGTTSRLQKLAPFNFLVDNNNRAPDIRKLFSTDSWDRTRFGLPRYNVAGSGSASSFRPWEFTLTPPITLGGAPTLDFPPTFPNLSGGGVDPFRPELRRLLLTKIGNVTNQSPQLRLNINRFLTSQFGQPKYRQLTEHITDPAVGGTITSIPTSAPYPPSTPAQREHWARRDRQQMARDIYVLLYTFCGGNDAVDPVTTANIPGNAVYTEAQLEAMAQFAVNYVDALDRDDVMTRFEFDANLANGWGLDDNPYDAMDSQTADRRQVVGVEHQQLTFSEVLAFSVAGNQSSDHAVTLYNDIDPTRDYLFIELRNVSPKNIPLATTESRQPNGIDSGIWRIEYLVPPGMGLDKSLTFYCGRRTNPTAVREVPGGGQFVIGTRTGTDSFTAPMGPPTERPSDFRVDVDSDGLFEVIAPNVLDPAPYTTTSNPSQPNFWPKVDLDLRHEVDRANSPGDPTDDHFEIVEPVPGATYFADKAAAGGTFLLKRRESPYLPRLLTTENDWVLVDETEFTNAGIFDLSGAMNAGQIEDQLDNLVSTERGEPLNREVFGQFAPWGTVGTRTNDNRHFNTLGFETNSQTPPIGGAVSARQFSLWQRHFDRDFTSIFELLSIPMYKPEDVTRYTEPSQLPPWQELQQAETLMYADGDRGNCALALDAGTMFMMPEHRDNMEVAPGSEDPDKDNRWYRLLEFVKVGTRMHRHLRFYGPGVDGKPGRAGINDDSDGEIDESDELGWFESDDVPPEFNVLRVPGKIDLNNIRHPEVFAGLLDDDEVHGLKIDGSTGPIGKVQHVPSKDPGDVVPMGAGVPNPNELRDWWAQFIRSRDRRDFVTDLYLPGLPHSRPFRSFAHMAHIPYSSASPSNPNPVNRLIEHTLLRRLPMDVDEGDAANTDVDPDTNRRLFELGTAGDHAGTSGNPVHPHVRHRMLSKIAGNVTNRSNVYIVHMTVGFFEAAVTPNGAVRIGGPLPDSPTHKGFFVIDCSKAEDAYNPGNGRFDFRDLVKYRLTIQ